MHGVDFPYMIEAVEVQSLPAPVRELQCPRTPSGRVTWVLRPECRLDVFRAANRVRGCEASYCLLLGLPTTPLQITAFDLRDWAKEVTERAGVPVEVLHEGTPFPCGLKACCECNKRTQRREEAACFEDLMRQKQSAEAAIDAAFGELPERDRTLLRRWATQEDPELVGKAIRQKVLAAELGVTERHVRRILQQAEALNPTVYQRLLGMRNYRFRKTGAYKV